jgi:hypothetical protein
MLISHTTFYVFLSSFFVTSVLGLLALCAIVAQRDRADAKKREKTTTTALRPPNRRLRRQQRTTNDHDTTAADVK